MHAWFCLFIFDEENLRSIIPNFLIPRASGFQKTKDHSFLPSIYLLQLFRYSIFAEKNLIRQKRMHAWFCLFIFDEENLRSIIPNFLIPRASGFQKTKDHSFLPSIYLLQLFRYSIFAEKNLIRQKRMHACMVLLFIFDEENLRSIIPNFLSPRARRSSTTQSHSREVPQ